MSNHQAATMEILARPSRAVRARTSRTDVQPWTSSACWHARKQILGVDLWHAPRQDVVDRLQDYKTRTKMALWLLCKLKDRSHMPMNIRTYANGLSLYKNCQFQTRPPPSVASHLRAASLTINLVNQVETAPWHPTSGKAVE